MPSRSGRRWREPNLCAGCRATIPHWQRICDACWGLLPWSHRKPIIEARDHKAPHLTAQHVAAAAAWLKSHSPAAVAARRLGEKE